MRTLLMMDKKIKPVAILLIEDIWHRMKEVAQDPSLRDQRGIRHSFTKETREKLCVGKDEFLLLEEEVVFWGMLERHGKAFTFLLEETECVDPKTVEPMVIIMILHISWI